MTKNFYEGKTFNTTVCSLMLFSAFFNVAVVQVENRGLKAKME